MGGRLNTDLSIESLKREVVDVHTLEVFPDILRQDMAEPSVHHSLSHHHQ